MKVIQNLVLSLIAPFRAIIYILSDFRVIIRVLIPLVFNIIFFFIFFVGFNSVISKWVIELDLNTGWEKVIEIIGGVLSLIISGIILLAIGMITFAPFNALTVEEILKENGFEKIRDYNGAKLVFYEIFRSIRFEIEKVFVQLVFFIFTGILHLVPILGSIFFTVINFIFAMYLNGLDLNDITNEMLRYNFKEKSNFLFKNRDVFLPFLACSTMLLSIPFVNILYLPIAVIGSTLLYVEVLKNEQTKGTQR